MSNSLTADQQSLATIKEDHQRRVGQIREQHQAGGTGRAITAALTQTVEETLRQLRDFCLVGLNAKQVALLQQQLALVAVAGTARGDMAPFSDVDLLFLWEKPSPEADRFTKTMVRSIWDCQLRLGQTVGSIKEVLELASTDATPGTAILTTRLLWGSKDLHQTFLDRHRKLLHGAAGRTLVSRAVAAINEEQAKFGSTNYLLEPDVKKSVGGLRDLHLVLWLAQVLHHTTDVAELEQRGLLGPYDAQAMNAATELLLRIRNELHFHAGRANDTLNRDEQMRIAKEWGYVDTPSQLAVEKFMQEYFRASTAVTDVRDRFVVACQIKPTVQRISDLLFSRKAGEGARVESGVLRLTDAKRTEIAGDPEKVLEYVELAALHDCQLDRATVEAIRANFLGASSDGPPRLVSPKARKLFLDMLSRPGVLSPTLRFLHKVGVLESYLPEFEHARNLLQFNAYHKYTVDEHTFIMLGHAESQQHDTGPLGEAYRRIVRKDLFHLAILLHDLGKGHTEDHSELGRRIAEDVARRFELSDQERHVLVFLVYRHLYMSHLAFHRDSTNIHLQVQLSREVGNASLLRKLFVLTAVDIMAVGPDTFNPWKSSLLSDLYFQTLQLFGGEEADAKDQDKAEPLRAEVLRLLDPASPMTGMVAELPIDFLVNTRPEQVVDIIKRREQLPPNEVAVFGDYHAEQNAIMYTVLTTEDLGDGLFAKICGALSAHHLDILSARIHTLSDRTVIDQFEVQDRHHFGPPGPDRIALVGKTIRRVLLGEVEVMDLLWNARSTVYGMKPKNFARDITRVVVDAQTLENCAIIDIFTSNRRGLLYTVAKVMHRLGLSVSYAKIATYEDEVVDVFYVSDTTGSPIRDPNRIADIESSILADIQKLATNPRAMGF